MTGKTVTRDRRRRRIFTFLWIAALSIVTITLIYWEMTALLYILATLGVTALLIVVALADLAHAEKVSDGIPPTESGAATAEISSTFNSNRSLKGSHPRK